MVTSTATPFENKQPALQQQVEDSSPEITEHPEVQVDDGSRLRNVVNIDSNQHSNSGTIREGRGIPINLPVQGSDSDMSPIQRVNHSNEEEFARPVPMGSQ
jgi:hypothetical protein